MAFAVPPASEDNHLAVEVAPVDILPLAVEVAPVADSASAAPQEVFAVIDKVSVGKTLAD